MCGERRIDRLDVLDPDPVSIDPVEQAHASAEVHRRQRENELVDQSRIQVLHDDIGPACNPDVPAIRRVAGLPQRALDAVVDEVERGSRTWFVRTKTGVWKGASSGQ